MLYSFSPAAVVMCAIVVGVLPALSIYLMRRAKSPPGFYAADAQIPWFINGVALAGDYLSAASFLGLCGMIAFYGYDGFLYSIGCLAGWVVALFVIAGPIQRLGKFTLADALDSQFDSPAIRLTAAISTLVIAVFYLIPQMVGAGNMIQPLLGIPRFNVGFAVIPPFAVGVVLVGVIVILITASAGMVSTTWVQFLKGALLVVFCAVLTAAILYRGLNTNPVNSSNPNFRAPTHIAALSDAYLAQHNLERLANTGPWIETPYVRLRDKATGIISIWRKQRIAGWTLDIVPNLPADETQYKVEAPGKPEIVNGKPHGTASGAADFYPIGNVQSLGSNSSDTPAEAENESAPEAAPATSTGPLGPLRFLRAFRNAKITVWNSQVIKDAGGIVTTIYFPVTKEGVTLLGPGNSPMFAGLGSAKWPDRLNFLSLMLALFCGTAALPHILIRFYTVKDSAGARRSAVAAIIVIGLFYLLMLYVGLGAMISGVLDPTDSNMAAPLLAKSFGSVAFAVIAAAALTTVLGTVAGLIVASAGAVAHDLMHQFFKMKLDDRQKVSAGRIAAVALGIAAIVLGISFQHVNVGFLVGWAFNIAASANLPAIVMLLFWKRTTAQGIAASVAVGLASSLAWIFLSADAFTTLYHLPASRALVPFNQPGLATIPLAFLTLIVVSLLTKRRTAVAPASA